MVTILDDCTEDGPHDIPQNLPASNFIKTMTVILSISILAWYICFLGCWQYQSSLKSCPKPVALGQWEKIQEVEILGYTHVCVCTHTLFTAKALLPRTIPFIIYD